MIIDSHTILSELAYKHPSIIPIINRFGIKLGLLEESIENLSHIYNIDLNLLLLVLNKYINNIDCINYLQNNIPSPSQIEEYFNKTLNYYTQIQLPNIDKHLSAFIGTSMAMNVPKKQLIELSKLLEEFKTNIQSIFLPNNLSSLSQNKQLRSSEELLAEMQIIMIKFLEGSYNENLCYATIFALHSLETDMRKHQKIKDSLEHIKNGNVNPLIQAESEEENNSQKSEIKILTSREIEVLKLITDGKLNKEIADILSISFQTVLSHRKNITTKLGIKTVSGLIFYAIKNGLVQVEN